jgi:putative acetyltransferase
VTEPDRTIRVRIERPGDAPAIHAVHAAAFPTDAEARLVDALRAAGRLTVSLVATRDDRLIGHVALSPTTVNGADAGGLGLGPIAVLADYRRRGAGSLLVRESLRSAAAGGAGFAVVLGDPAYYRRFGFRRAADAGLANEYGADEEFMIIALPPGAARIPRGLLRYAPEFAGV